MTSVDMFYNAFSCALTLFLVLRRHGDLVIFIPWVQTGLFSVIFKRLNDGFISLFDSEVHECNSSKLPKRNHFRRIWKRMVVKSVFWPVAKFPSQQTNSVLVRFREADLREMRNIQLISL